MNIIVNDESKATPELMSAFAAAAEECIRLEAEDPEYSWLKDVDIEISLSFVSMDEIHELNREYRGVESPTDVLSFPMYDEFDPDPEGGQMMLGDVVICLEKAEAQAEEFGHSRERETVYLFTHSILHLLGYDHMEEDEKSLMRAREEEVMSVLDLQR